VLCHEKLLKGHLKGKWLSAEQIAYQPENLVEGSNVVLRMGKYAGVGTVRKRSDGSGSIRIKDVTRTGFVLSDNHPTLKDVIAANESSLERLEKTALWELRGYISRTRLPVNISFSGGKDSLASLCLCRKAMPGAEVLFVNTGLEFPETVAYVRNFCRAHSLKLHEIEGEATSSRMLRPSGLRPRTFAGAARPTNSGR